MNRIRQIVEDIKSKNTKPIYFLMGEEAYYIDLISDYIENNILSEEEKGFNQMVLYGWQSYRAQFIARPEMQTFEFPFSKFQPYRITAPLNLTKLRRIGLVAIGREFHADLTVCRISLY